MSITSLIGEENHSDEYSVFLQNLYLSGGRRIAIVLAIRPGVSGWMRRTLHQLVYCTVGPSSLALGSAQNPQGLRYRVVLERHQLEIAAEK
ncbi:hypothetical protein FDZ29_16015 [Salmonella enterica]|nr:hypothetical protein [Salmonella enterica]